MTCRFCGEPDTIVRPNGAHAYKCGFMNNSCGLTPCTEVYAKILLCPTCSTGVSAVTNGRRIFVCGFSASDGTNVARKCRVMANSCAEQILTSPELVTHLVPEICTCDLFMGGCTCGVFKREQLRKNQEHVSG